MYQLDSTRGLRTTAHTVDQALAILGQHLHDIHRDGPIQWLITAPGDIKGIGYLDITATNPEENAESIQLALDMCRDQITAKSTATADITTTPHDEAADSIHQALELCLQQLTAGAGINLN